MEKIFTPFLVFHIICGFTAFVAAPVAMIVAKGNNKHRISGKVFFGAMTGVCISAFVMSVVHRNPFLFMVSGFSYYSVVSGYRWIYRKKTRSAKDVPLIDWVIVIGAAIFNLSLLTYGLYNLYNAPDNAFGYISTVFGLLGVNFVRTDIQQFFNPPAEKNTWLLKHMGGMVGGYIATVSAFSAVNFNFLPAIIQWLWPTIIGVPLLYLWIRYYRKKFKTGKKVADMVEVKNY